MKDEDELQSWFVRHFDGYLSARGRRLIGWDEILEGGLAPHAAVMSWRNEQGGITAARAGHDVLMAPNQTTYLDAYQSQDKTTEPLAIGGHISLQQIYCYEPLPAALNAIYSTCCGFAIYSPLTVCKLPTNRAREQASHRPF